MPAAATRKGGPGSRPTPAEVSTGPARAGPVEIDYFVTGTQLTACAMIQIPSPLLSPRSNVAVCVVAGGSKYSMYPYWPGATVVGLRSPA